MDRKSTLVKFSPPTLFVRRPYYSGPAPFLFTNIFGIFPAGRFIECTPAKLDETFSTIFSTAEKVHPLSTRLDPHDSRNLSKSRLLYAVFFASCI